MEKLKAKEINIQDLLIKNTDCRETISRLEIQIAELKIQIDILTKKKNEVRIEYREKIVEKIIEVPKEVIKYVDRFVDRPVNIATTYDEKKRVDEEEDYKSDLEVDDSDNE